MFFILNHPNYIYFLYLYHSSAFSFSRTVELQEVVSNLPQQQSGAAVQLPHSDAFWPWNAFFDHSLIIPEHQSWFGEREFKIKKTPICSGCSQATVYGLWLFTTSSIDEEILSWSKRDLIYFDKRQTPSSPSGGSKRRTTVENIWKPCKSFGTQHSFQHRARPYIIGADKKGVWWLRGLGRRMSFRGFRLGWNTLKVGWLRAVKTSLTKSRNVRCFKRAFSWFSCLSRPFFKTWNHLFPSHESSSLRHSSSDRQWIIQRCMQTELRFPNALKHMPSAKKHFSGETSARGLLGKHPQQPQAVPKQLDAIFPYVSSCVGKNVLRFNTTIDPFLSRRTICHGSIDRMVPWRSIGLAVSSVSL